MVDHRARWQPRSLRLEELEVQKSAEAQRLARAPVSTAPPPALASDAVCISTVRQRTKYRNCAQLRIGTSCVDGGRTCDEVGLVVRRW